MWVVYSMIHVSCLLYDKCEWSTLWYMWVVYSMIHVSCLWYMWVVYSMIHVSCLLYNTRELSTLWYMWIVYSMIYGVVLPCSAFVAGFQLSGMVIGKHTCPFSSTFGWYILVLKVTFGGLNGYSAGKSNWTLKAALLYGGCCCNRET